MPSRQFRRFQSLPTARKRLDNPYFRTRQSDHISSSPVKGALSRMSPRSWAYGFLIVALLATVIWLFGFSTVFIIKAVDISGVPDEDTFALEALVWEQAETSRAWLLPQSRLFVFNAEELRSRIAESTTLASIRVIKKAPSTLQLKLTERSPALVWYEADTYYLIDSDGWVIRTLTAPQEGLAILYNNGSARLNGKQVTGQNEAIAAAIELQSEFSSRFSHIGYKQFVVDDSFHTVTVVLRGGQLMYLTTNQSLADQLDRFDLLLKETLKDSLAKLRYIDLRYGDKIFYK